MLNFRVVQSFDQHGRANGHHVEVSGQIHDLQSCEIEGPDTCDDFAPYFHFLESVRSYILTTNLVSSQTHLHLLEQIQDGSISLMQ